MKVKIKKVRDNAILPSYATAGAAGMDMYTANEEPVTLKPLQRELIPLGVAIELEEGYVAKIYPRSGLAAKKGITLSNAVGICDSDYRGEIMASLVNLSYDEYTVQPGDRVCQMIIMPVEKAELVEVEELGSTERGAGGFGHTGFNKSTLQ